jgi:hypothetical protein
LAGEYSGPASAPRAIALSEETLSERKADELVRREFRAPISVEAEDSTEPESGASAGLTPVKDPKAFQNQDAGEQLVHREQREVIKEMGRDPQEIDDPEAFLADTIAGEDADERHVAIKAFQSKLGAETVSWGTFEETIAAAVERAGSTAEDIPEDDNIEPLVEELARTVEETPYRLAHLRAAIDRLEHREGGDGS